MEPLREPLLVYVGQGTSTLRTDKDFEVVRAVDRAMEDVTTRCCFLSLLLLPGVRVQPTEDGFLVEGGGVYTETSRETAPLPPSLPRPRARSTGIVKPATFTTIAATYAPKKAGRRRKMTRRYCRKTTCRKMGFSQKASCRPWKNCY